MNPEKQAATVAALATIAHAQAQIMHALTFLAVEHGEEVFPSIRESVDKFSDWLMAQHGVVTEAEHLIPPTVVVVPPINIEVM